MKHVTLPDDNVRRLSFYLAMEEYVASHIDEQDCFFLWQVEPSVIFGRNQLIENEVNLDYCRKHNISTYRRKSGGGCVYADMNNVMFSYITNDEPIGFTFSKYLNMVVEMLRRIGVNARISGRNDLLVDNRKVSGNAFYRMSVSKLSQLNENLNTHLARNIVHGTILYDTDMLNMVGSITPTDAKLLCKGVASVRQRVALLKNYIYMTIDEFKDFAIRNLCDGEISLTEYDVGQIETIEKEYLTDEFIYGNNPKYTLVRKGRIETVGDFEIRMEVKNGVVKAMTILGDYFILGDIDKTIIEPLRDVPLERKAIEAALPDDLHHVILNLKKDDFINLLTDE